MAACSRSSLIKMIDEFNNPPGPLPPEPDAYENHRDFVRSRYGVDLVGPEDGIEPPSPPKAKTPAPGPAVMKWRRWKAAPHGGLPLPRSASTATVHRPQSGNVAIRAYTSGECPVCRHTVSLPRPSCAAPNLLI